MFERGKIISGFWRDFIVLEWQDQQQFRTVKLLKPLEQRPQSMPHIRDPGCWVGVASPFVFPPSFSQRKEKRKCGNNGLPHFPVALGPLYPNQLCKENQNNKKFFKKRRDILSTGSF